MTPLLAAVGTPRRRLMLQLIWNSELSAGEIHRALGDVTFGAVSQHLAILTRAGLVTRRAEGRRRLYRTRKGALGPLRALLAPMWDDALAALKWRAELEEARRGPRPRRKPRTRRSRP